MSNFCPMLQNFCRQGSCAWWCKELKQCSMPLLAKNGNIPVDMYVVVSIEKDNPNGQIDLWYYSTLESANIKAKSVYENNPDNHTFVSYHNDVLSCCDLGFNSEEEKNDSNTK